MSAPLQSTIFDGIDATWAPIRTHQISGWAIREGGTGGKRVCSASKIGDCVRIEHAEDTLASLGQDLLFQIRGEEQLLDAQLEKRGYQIIDPVVLLGRRLPSHSSANEADHHAKPNEKMKAIWAEGGIGSGRLDVMDRVTLPKAYSQLSNAVAFSAIYEGICFTHAVEVAQSARRQGLGRRLMQSIGSWAVAQNAHYACVLTVRENKPALSLYQGLGFEEIGQYHYRIKA